MRPKLDGTVKRLNMYATEELMARVADWRRLEPDNPSTSEAIRRLIEHGLNNPKVVRKQQAYRDRIKAA